MSLMSLGMVVMSLGVGLEQELGDEFDECLASERGTARERALSESGGERGLVVTWLLAHGRVQCHRMRCARAMRSAFCRMRAVGGVGVAGAPWTRARFGEH